MVCSLTLCFLAASATEVRSHSRRIATICSSVNRLLRIGSSLAKEPFFQKLTDRKTSSGHNRRRNIRANYPTFLQRPHWPRETAAAFLRYDHQTGETHFYFSPAF